LHARISETQGGRALAVDLDGADYLVERILPNGAVMRDLLDLEQAPVGLKANLPQDGQVLESFADTKSRVSLMVVSVRSARPSW
jgi:hypothetical protein